MRRQPLHHTCQIALSVLALGVVAAMSTAHAQPYPSKMIRFISATAPGNPPDIIVRIIATELSESED